MKFKLTCLLLGFSFLTSCLQNPEAKLQNERINDLKEKNEYLNSKIKETNDKVQNLENKIEELSNKLEKKTYYRRKSFDSKKTQDSLNINLKIRN